MTSVWDFRKRKPLNPQTILKKMQTTDTFTQWAKIHTMQT